MRSIVGDGFRPPYEGDSLNHAATTVNSRLALAYLIALVPPLLWAGNFLLARMFRNDIPPLQMSFWRWVLAMLILVAFNYAGLRAHAAQIRKELPMLAFLGLVGVTAFSAFVYAALHFTTVINGALINSLLPVATFVLALFILGDRISFQQMLGVILALLGTLVVITRGSFTELQNLSF